MSIPVALSRRPRLPLHRRLWPLFIVAISRLLARLRPSRLRWVLEHARRGAEPATAEQTGKALRDVVAVSMRCAGQACLQRSIATALLCRSRGVWPTWCTGVRTSPFAAHAWVEAEGEMIGEPYPAGHYRPLITVPPTDNR
ncbi:lasso peptide biosynthesis B2 protein [Streptomyces sp. NPDC046881]|uniref:lasso peptide biosynthesis B2 protein n=1 Tax=Streptomyces sp. NPDC046881 TaxID=3155374 RepID=UPI0033EE84A4